MDEAEKKRLITGYLASLPEDLKVMNCAGCGAFMTNGDPPAKFKSIVRRFGGKLDERPHCAPCLGKMPRHASTQFRSPGQIAKLGNNGG